MAWINRLKTAQRVPQPAPSTLASATALSFLSAGRLGPVWLPHHPAAEASADAQGFTRVQTARSLMSHETNPDDALADAPGSGESVSRACKATGAWTGAGVPNAATTTTSRRGIWGD